jgi:hypothetical protein
MADKLCGDEIKENKDFAENMVMGERRKHVKNRTNFI